MTQSSPESVDAVRAAQDALLAFRHGDTKHLTQEHARILFDALTSARSSADIAGLADWLKHMQDLNQTLAHIPEMAVHIGNLRRWESAVRYGAPAQAPLNTRLGIGLLWTVHSALDEALGDSDVTHIEDDSELRERHPVQWAAQRLAEAISLLEEAPPLPSTDQAGGK